MRRMLNDSADADDVMMKIGERSLPNAHLSSRAFYLI
jgi:hypothetical protein